MVSARRPKPVTGVPHSTAGTRLTKQIKALVLFFGFDLKIDAGLAPAILIARGPQGKSSFPSPCVCPSVPPYPRLYERRDLNDNVVRRS